MAFSCVDRRTEMIKDSQREDLQVKNALKWNLQQFAEGGEGDPTPPQTVTIGDKEYSVEDLQKQLDGYSKLEKQFTKVSQENSELKKVGERAKAWLDFEETVNQFTPEVQQQFVKQVNDFFAAAQTGNVTQQDISGINKAIKAAEKAGDDKTADGLKGARDEALHTLHLNEMFEDLEEQAETDGIEFKKREFKKFLAKYLEDEGYDEDDDFDDREIKRAYKLYRAEKKEKASETDKKKNLPNVGTGGTGVSAGTGKDKSKEPKNIREATRMAMERASQLFG